MATKNIPIDDKMATVIIHPDSVPHITASAGHCGSCEDRPCITCCPASNYRWEESDRILVFNHEGCLECGTCRFACPHGAINWGYPRGGKGVSYSC